MIVLPIESRLIRLQRSFAEAILSDDAPIPASVRAASGRASVSRFGVYRNNVLAGLIGAMAARYPVVRNLLWPDSFDGAARLYVLSEPPRSPVLLHYGDRFPQFLRAIGEGAATDYVADIAELEDARVRAYHAADDVPLPRERFAQLLPEALPRLRMTLHPSVTLLRSRFPIVSAWEAAMRGDDGSEVAWRPEAALIARPFNEVCVWALPAGAYDFLTAIRDGRSIGEAVGHASTQEPDFDLAATFSVMVSAAIVTELKPESQASI